MRKVYTIKRIMLLGWTNGTSSDGNIQQRIMKVKKYFIYKLYSKSLRGTDTLVLWRMCLKFYNKTQENCGKYK